MPPPQKIKEEKEKRKRKTREDDESINIDAVVDASSSNTSNVRVDEPSAKRRNVAESLRRRNQKRSRSQFSESSMKKSKGALKSYHQNELEKTQQQVAIDTSKKSESDDKNGRTERQSQKEQFDCPDSECSKFYANISSLRSHAEKVHKKKIYWQCNGGCDAPKFLDRKTVKAHLNREHNNGRFDEYMELVLIGGSIQRGNQDNGGGGKNSVRSSLQNSRGKHEYAKSPSNKTTVIIDDSKSDNNEEKSTGDDSSDSASASDDDDGDGKDEKRAKNAHEGNKFIFVLYSNY